MTAINQKEYLKKYLGIGKGSGVKKKKIKTEKVNGKSLKIIDDDVDVALAKEIQEDLANLNEDAPQIVAVIDDRPPSLRIDEKTKDILWKPIGQVIPNNPTEEVKFNNFKISKGTSKPEINILKTTHLKNKDISPLRRIKKQIDDFPAARSSEKDRLPAVNVHKHEDSAPRNSTWKDSYQNEGDKSRKPSSEKNISPLRRSKWDDDISSPRESRIYEDISSRIKVEPDDISPPRKTKRSHDISPPRKTKQHDFSQSRKSCHNDNLSPPRRTHRRSKMSPQKSRGEDISPPRKSQRHMSMSQCQSPQSSDMSPPRKVRRDQDNSPPRKSRHIDSSSSSRKCPQENNNVTSSKISRWSRDSPTRSEKHHESSTKPVHSSGKMERTMSGKKSGLQNAKDIVQEILTIKQKEEELFKNMSNEVSGQNATTISRKKKTTTPEEDAKKREKDKEMEVKYSRWGKGIKQVQDINEKNEEMLHEMSKPLARYADDEDLETYLKEQERDGDPMLAYIRKKKRKKQVEAGIPDKPTYMGDFEPNRFGIQPGYRWDGVDRSNGYEKKLFESRNSKRAAEEEAMKWSTEDM